ncbi:hypothetical protein KVMX100_70127 [Klebsiella variicola]|nr:hypothetical protein KVMX100_70127 [Klebsiella variicola]
MEIVTAPHLAARNVWLALHGKRHDILSRPSSSPDAVKRTHQAEVTYFVTTSFS